MLAQTPMWIWGLPVLIASPWLLATLLLWRLLPRDGYVPPSYGQRLLRNR